MSKGNEDREKGVFREAIGENPETEGVTEIWHEEQMVDALTTYFRRASRGRIVDMPGWAQ